MQGFTRWCPHVYNSVFTMCALGGQSGGFSFHSLVFKHHMCCLLVLQDGVRAFVLSDHILHLAVILFLESHQHYLQVLEDFQLVFGHGLCGGQAFTSSRAPQAMYTQSSFMMGILKVLVYWYFSPIVCHSIYDSSNSHLCSGPTSVACKLHSPF